MSPQEISALMALLGVLKQLSGWPFGILIFLLGVGPWVMAFIFLRSINNRYEGQEGARQKEMRVVLEQYRQDVTEIKRLYESNVRLVDDSNQAFQRLEIIYGEAISVISLNTQTQTHLADQIKNNQFCPMVRKAGPQ